MTLALASKQLFMASPDEHTALWANVYYTRAIGIEQCCVHYYERRDDLYDAVYLRYSGDNGRTWSAPQAVKHVWQTDQGMIRTWRDGGGWGWYVDPARNLLVRLYNEAILPNDDVHEYQQQCTICYAISADGGRTVLHQAQVIHQGIDYHAQHPLPGVWIGRNSMAIGGGTARPIRNRRDQLLQPVDIPPLGVDGKLTNPGGGPDYNNTAVLLGTWSADNHLTWELSQMVMADPQRTTRGLMETTLALIADGRILMILRGSNAGRPELPGYRWYAVSTDDGYTWTTPQPWHDTDGQPVYSPSSSSYLLSHSNGKTYWIANILSVNPKGNGPRYPLVIGEVDADSLLLQRESLFNVEDRHPEQDEGVQFSNFAVYEDRETQEIVITCTHFLPKRGEWNGDSYIYRLTT